MVGPGAAGGSKSPALIRPGKNTTAATKAMITASSKDDLSGFLIFFTSYYGLIFKKPTILSLKTFFYQHKGMQDIEVY
jgi:hypothetical protein